MLTAYRAEIEKPERREHRCDRGEVDTVDACNSDGSDDDQRDVKHLRVGAAIQRSRLVVRVSGPLAIDAKKTTKPSPERRMTGSRHHQPNATLKRRRRERNTGVVRGHGALELGHHNVPQREQGDSPGGLAEDSPALELQSDHGGERDEEQAGQDEHPHPR